VQAGEVAGLIRGIMNVAEAVHSIIIKGTSAVLDRCNGLREPQSDSILVVVVVSSSGAGCLKQGIQRGWDR